MRFILYKSKLLVAPRPATYQEIVDSVDKANKDGHWIVKELMDKNLLAICDNKPKENAMKGIVWELQDE